MRILRKSRLEGPFFFAISASLPADNFNNLYITILNDLQGKRKEKPDKIQKPVQVSSFLQRSIVTVMMANFFRPTFSKHFLLLTLLCALLFPPGFSVLAGPPPPTPNSFFLPFVTFERQKPVASSDWLAYLNAYRAQAKLAPVAEDTQWSEGAYLHARYIVKNDVIEHQEEDGNEWYSEIGRQAAETSNLMASWNGLAPDRKALDLWMRGPFHALGILDPRLMAVGFGSYRALDGGFQMAAVLDVLRGLQVSAASDIAPVLWPGPGSNIWLLSFNGGEYPDPLSSCPGYSLPTGLPILLQLTGSTSPEILQHTFQEGATPLEHCVFNSTSYDHPDAAARALGQTVLEQRQAVVLIPRYPLEPGKTYSVRITTDDETYAWSFSTLPAGHSQIDASLPEAWDSPPEP